MSNGSAGRVVTDRQTDGRYQVHYLPRFAVDIQIGHTLSVSITTNQNYIIDLDADQYRSMSINSRYFIMLVGI